MRIRLNLGIITEALPDDPFIHPEEINMLKRLILLLTVLALLCSCCLAEEEEDDFFFSADGSETAAQEEAAEDPAAVLAEAPVKERLPRETLMTFFTDSVFVGDSVSERVRTYVKDQRKVEPGLLSNAKFLVKQSYMLFMASKNYVSEKSANLTYNGREMSLCTIMGAMKPKRVFILLGINDYIGEKIDKGMEYVTRTVELIHKYAPGTEIYFQSLTPVTRNFCKKKDYRTLWDEYNAALKKLSETVDFTYVEIAERLKDEEGYLPDEWSTDREYHVNNKGIPIWIDELLDFAQQRYEQGFWTPE